MRIVQSQTLLPYPRSLPWPPDGFPPGLVVWALRSFPQFDRVAGAPTHHGRARHTHRVAPTLAPPARRLAAPFQADYSLLDNQL